MSDSRKKKRGAKQENPETASKTDIEIAKYLRNKCPKKQTLLMNQKVYYFIGTKAVDTLMESKWAKGSKKESTIFHNRGDCVEFLNRLRDMELFARAEKITVKKVETKKSKKSEKKDETEDEKGDDASKGKRDIKDKDGKGDKGDASVKKKDKSLKEEKATEVAKEETSVKRRKNKDKQEKLESDGDPESPKTDAKDGEKRKKKIRLELHPDQGFFDNSDAYVWIYEPTSIKNILLGTGIILGAIGVCLFPLWPPIVRQGVYYLSLVAIGLIGLLIGVSLFRYVVFAMVWAATMGKVHFWYLPNLTEDCGFFESFVPLYSCSKGGEKDEKDDKSKKKGKKSKDKDSDKDDKESDREKENKEDVQSNDKDKADTDKDKDDTGSEPGKEPDENDKDSNGSYVMVSA